MNVINSKNKDIKNHPCLNKINLYEKQIRYKQYS